jgi:hypothetical protein
MLCTVTRTEGSNPSLSASQGSGRRNLLAALILWLSLSGRPHDCAEFVLNPIPDPLAALIGPHLVRKGGSGIPIAAEKRGPVALGDSARVGRRARLIGSPLNA